MKTSQIAFLICFTFCLSWLPPWISFFVFVFLSPMTQLTPVCGSIILFTRLTYLINTFSNPMLYTIMSKSFRAKIRQIVCWNPASILYKSTAGRYRPISYPKFLNVDNENSDQTARMRMLLVWYVRLNYHYIIIIKCSKTFMMVSSFRNETIRKNNVYRMSER